MQTFSARDTEPGRIFDVVVIGGGPAGSSIAGHLAQRGADVVVVEGKRFPREHIGESLLAVSVPILDELGVLPKLEREGYPRKLGALFIWGPRTSTMKLDMPRPSYAFQVQRARFDHILMDHAIESGASVWQEHWVKEPIWDENGRMCGVTVAEAGQPEPVEVRARFVVDASGLFQFLPRKLGLPIDVFGPRRVAITSYYTGALRHDAPYVDDIVSEACDDGWLWFIPLTKDLTSVGFVGDEEDLDGRPADMLARQLESSTLTKRLLGPARVSRPARVLKYTNHMIGAPLWRDGYVLIGDTAIFVDPLFSTGVHGSLYSAASASAGITSVLDGSVSEEDASAWYDRRFRKHYGRVQQMIRLLYGLHAGPRRFWQSRTLADIGEQDAASLVRDIGVAGIDFFARCADDGALDLPAPIHRLVDGISGRMRPIRLPDNAVVEVADGVVLEPDFMRQNGKLVPSRILHDTGGRKQEVEFAQHTLLHRLVGALDGRRSVREVVAAVNQGEAPDEKVALLIGALVDSGLLSATRVPATAGAV